MTTQNTAANKANETPKATTVETKIEAKPAKGKAKGKKAAKKAVVNAVMMNGTDITPFINVAEKLHKGKLQVLVNTLGAKGKTASQIIASLEPLRTGKRTAHDIFVCCATHLAAVKGQAKGTRNYIGKNIEKVAVTKQLQVDILKAAMAVGNRLLTEYKAIAAKAAQAKAQAKTQAKAVETKPNKAQKAQAK